MEALDRAHAEQMEALRKLAEEPSVADGVPGGTPTKGWPIHSDALAVHPLDIAEAQADAKAKGVPTQFTADGRVVLTDRAHRKRYLKAYGFRDNQGGYGD